MRGIGFNLSGIILKHRFGLLSRWPIVREEPALPLAISHEIGVLCADAKLAE